MAEGATDRVAVIDQQGVALTHGQLRSLAASVGTGLSQAGLTPGDHLGVFLPNRSSWPVLALAAAHSGVGLLGLNTRFRQAELNHLLAVAEVDVVAATPNFLGLDAGELLGGLDRPVKAIMIPARFDPDRSDHKDDSNQPGPSWDQLCDTAAVDPVGQHQSPLIGFTTSGTTGFPKVAMHTQGQTISHLFNVIDAFSLGPETVALAPLPLCGAFGYTVAMATLLAGGRVVTNETWDPDAAAAAIDAHEVTYFSASDDMILATIGSDGFRQESTWSTGGFADFTNAGAQAVAEADRITGGRTTLAGLYGSSEGFALMATFDPMDTVVGRSRNGGHVVGDDMEVRCCDPQTRRPLPVGEAGELWFRGPNLITGYLNNPDATEAAFTEDGWYRSGDLGQLVPPDDRGRPGFVFLSRLGDSLRLRGFLCDPKEIEHHLEEHPLVELAQVVGVERPGVGDVAVAFVKVDGGSPSPESDIESALHSHCKTGLANYKRPERIIPIDRFPVTEGPNGVKIRKVDLRQRAVELFDRATPGEPGR